MPMSNKALCSLEIDSNRELTLCYPEYVTYVALRKTSMIGGVYFWSLITTIFPQTSVAALQKGSVILVVPDDSKLHVSPAWQQVGGIALGALRPAITN
ncbi:hypothetical protein X798_01182 [Onchocerca flexuosa]|uniref:Peptidase A1 domain-containing protein n=2 Tax=Onchocerca flexuosa TaxID=387005 RepID=A0A183H3D6_9BILA|nr:hypothetical protein X798_01182 [Onchocerca flexuosa]VDO31511.1 unnamed protein product [Onchocerca flexuosa]